MREYNGFTTNQTEPREATDEFLADRFRNSTQMFQPQRPGSPTVEDGMTMVMDPISQDDLRTEMQADPFPAAMVPLRPARAGLATRKRAALVGATLLAAALLVYIGRGYIHEPAEVAQPAEVAVPAEADETVTEIPLTAETLPGQPIDVAPVVVPSVPAVVVISPLSDAAIPVASISSPPIEASVSAPNDGPAESTEQVVGQSPSDNAVEPVADLPVSAVGDGEIQPTADDVVAAPAATTDQVSDQTETVTASDETETVDSAVADETTSTAEEAVAGATTSESSSAPVAQVELPRVSSQQQNRDGDDNRAAGAGLKVASEVLNKLSQPISNAGQAGRYFSQR